jgi:ssDNA-binding replication factor A large subunit
VRGNQNRPQHEYNYIKDLFIGMENFVLLVRVIFVFPVKTFINKKGVESCLLNILVGDKSGTIECTMFGELVQRFEGRLKEDQIFELANAAVSEGNYLGNRYNKLIINETSKVSLKEDDPSVPFSEDYFITVKKLVFAPVCSENMVVCLVKDTEKAEDFTTKAGKDMRKKLIYLCDPEEKVEVELTLFGDKCDEIFENQPYMFKGVNVG